MSDLPKTIKINELPEVSSINDTDIFIVEDGSITHKITGKNLIAYIQNHGDISDYYVHQSSVGEANGIAPLDENRKVPSDNINFGTTTGTVFDGGRGKALEDGLDAHILDSTNKINDIVDGTTLVGNADTVDGYHADDLAKTTDLSTHINDTTKHHAHDNKDVLDSITATKVAEWDAGASGGGSSDYASEAGNADTVDGYHATEWFLHSASETTQYTKIRDIPNGKWAFTNGNTQFEDYPESLTNDNLIYGTITINTGTAGLSYKSGTIIATNAVASKTRVVDFFIIADSDGANSINIVEHLPINGGRLTGNLEIANTGSAGSVNTTKYITYDEATYIRNYVDENNQTDIAFNSGAMWFNQTVNGTTKSNVILHSGNLINYALPLTGGRLKGNLIIKPTTGGAEGGEILLAAAEDTTTRNGIVLDNCEGSFRIFGQPSADGTTKTGVGTPLVINPYNKTILGSYTMTGYTVSPSNTDYTTNRNRNAVLLPTAQDPGVNVATSYANGSLICIYE